MYILKRHRIKIVSFVAFLFIATGSYAQKWLDMVSKDEKGTSITDISVIKLKAEEYFRHEKKEYFKRNFDQENYPELDYKNVREYIEYRRWEEYWGRHVYEDGSIVPRLKEFRSFSEFISGPSKAASASWVNINRTEAPGGYWGMGRVREIAFHPTDPEIFWLGTDQGGIWKTIDNGLSYHAIGDGLPFLRVSSICVNHTDPDIIYIMAGGTGASWWDPSIGVYKTTDGGTTWNETGMSFELSSLERHRRLVISPLDPEILLLTSDNGIYRSADGGDSWTKVLTGDCWDMVFHPGGSAVIAGVQGELYRSENSGLSWTRVTQIGLGGRITRIAVSGIDNLIIAADLNVTLDSESNSIIYLSRDGGLTWLEKSRLQENTGGGLAFSSVDPERLYRGWTHIQSSVDLGQTWTQLTQWYRDNIHPEIHADFFAIKNNPLIENTLYFCNDGGLYILDESTGEWTERSKGLIISQYYSLSGSQSDPSVLLCGSQDNGGWYRKSNGTWRTTNGGDAMHTWQHPSIAYHGYSSYPGGKIYKTSTGWVTISDISKNISPEQTDGDWNSRYAIDPEDENIIVTGCFPDVFRSVNGGKTWTKISNDLTGGTNLHCIIIPEANNNYIYASAGPVIYKSVNLGVSWKAYRLPGSETIQEIAADPYNPERIWVVRSGFNNGSKVFYSSTGGQSWINISGSLPNISGHSIIYQKGTNDGIYIGMSYGVYYKNALMDDWVYYGHGIPNTEIRDLDIQYNAGKIRCATYGRGLFEADLYPNEGTPPEASFSALEANVCLGDTVRFINESSGTDKFIWDFGDGSLSEQFSPEHIYTSAGRYTVSLTAIGDQLTTNMTRKLYIEIDPYMQAVSIGEKERDSGSGLYLNDDSFGMIFNVHFPSIISSVKVYTFVKGKRTFEIRDNKGMLISHATIFLDAGETIVPLMFKLNPGTGYVLKVSGFTNLFFNSNGASYPYGKTDLVSITGNTGFDRDKYYYFYDWNIQYMTCSDELLPETGESENIAADRIIISPSPVRDIFTVSLMGFDPAELIDIWIYNIDGILVYRLTAGLERELTLPRSILPAAPGIFILEAGSSGKSFSKKLVTLN